MDLQNLSDVSGKRTFFSHVFSTTEEGKAELLNVVQYSLLAIIPVIVLNKSINRFIPEADPDKSSLELLVEIFIQMVIMFCGIVLIHRIITYVPTYSGFKYEGLALTNVILAFLIIVLSIQSKLGLKVNILTDRLSDLWNGTTSSGSNKAEKKTSYNVRVAQATAHAPSQADFLDHSAVQGGVFPPAPIATTKQSTGVYDMMMRTGGAAAAPAHDAYMGPMAANSVLGGAFGSSF